MEQACLIDRILIDRSRGVAPFCQLREALRDSIMRGDFPPGQRLPAIREIAAALRLSPVTVQRAIGDLVREGVLSSRSRSGTFVNPRQVAGTDILAALLDHGGPLSEHFLDQVVVGLREGFGDPARPISLSLIDPDHVTAEQVLSMCRIRNSNSVLAYRPANAVLVGALRRLAEHLPVCSLVHAIPDARVDHVDIDPKDALRDVLLPHLAGGRRTFVLASWHHLLPGEFDLASSPYRRLEHAFREILGEAAVEVVELISRAATKRQARQEITAAAADLPESLVVLGLPCGVPTWIAESRSDVDAITYTESRAGLEGYARGDTVLYAGMEICAREAARLLSRRLREGPGTPPTTVTVHPQVFKPRMGDGRD